MLYEIENDYLRVKMKSLGAELCSVFDKRDQTEHLWQADPAFWGWHAPVLFPVVGRCLNDQINIEAQVFKMEKHGFARKSEFKLLQQHPNELTFLLESNETTLAQYPFHFSFSITYRLVENELKTIYEVKNNSSERMYFSLGGHPAFKVPFFDGEQYEDYAISFKDDVDLDRHWINEDGFFNGIKTPVLNHSHLLPLQCDLFKDDALIFKNLQSRSVTLQSNKNSKQLHFSFPDFNYLGLWAKVNAPYVCIEPWLGCADTVAEPTDFKAKEAIQTLSGLETRSYQFSILIASQ